MFIPQLLAYPNPTDPLNGEAASLLLRNPAAYAARIRESVRLHASAPVVFEEEDDDNDTLPNFKAGRISGSGGSGTGSEFGSPSTASMSGSSTREEVRRTYGFLLPVDAV